MQLSRCYGEYFSRNHGIKERIFKDMLSFETYQILKVTGPTFLGRLGLDEVIEAEKRVKSFIKDTALLDEDLVENWPRFFYEHVKALREDEETLEKIKALEQYGNKSNWGASSSTGPSKKAISDVERNFKKIKAMIDEEVMCLHT